LEEQDIPTTVEETRRTLDEIWPIIQEANKIAPKFSKIPKPLVQLPQPRSLPNGREKAQFSDKIW
jgi:hypothetical protein